jgi:hypothetical protein
MSALPTENGKTDWSPTNTAPKDGTFLRLLVAPQREAFTAFEDSLEPYETIGFNNLRNTGEDRWEFAGWDWSQDCFISGHGDVVGWLPFSPAPAPSELLTLVKLFRDTLQYYIRLDEKTGDHEGAALKRNTLGVVMNAIEAVGVSDLSMLETHLKSLVIANPEKALLAALDDEMRMWFLAELIAVASGRVPLPEIEALVSWHLSASKGGTA